MLLYGIGWSFEKQECREIKGIMVVNRSPILVRENWLNSNTVQ